MAVTTIYAQPGQVLNLGRVGSGNQTVIKFDLDGWYTELETARTQGIEYSIQLVYMVGGPIVRLTEPFSWSDIYDANRTPTYELTWEIDSSLTTYPGSGTCQILFTTGEDTYLTYLYQTIVTRSVVDFSSLTEQEKTTYAQWLYVLQNAIQQANGFNVTSQVVPFDEDPSVEKIIDPITSVPTLDFSLPASRPFYIRQVYNSMTAMAADCNNSSIEIYDFYTINKVSTNADFPGFLYMRNVDLTDSYNGNNPSNYQISSLPAEPVTGRLYLVSSTIGTPTSENYFPQYDIISYTSSSWKTVYRFIADLSVQGFQGVGINSVTFALDQQSNKYRVYYTTYDPRTQTTSSPIMIADSDGFYQYFDNQVTSASDSATAASNAKNDAVSAKNDAVTAKNTAVSAKTAIENMSATGSVDANIGTPAITVTKTTVGDHVNLDFAFTNMKGEKGDTGAAINVIGHANTLAGIPAGTYHNGDGYLVGTTIPYTLYIYYDNQWNDNGQVGGSTVDINTTTHALVISI